MRKRTAFYWVVLAAVFLTALSVLRCGIYWPGFKGEWIDRAASRGLNRLTGFPVTVLDVKITRGLQMDFSLMLVGTPEKTWAASGKGRLRLDRWEWWKKEGLRRIYLGLENVALMEDLYRQSPLIAWASGQAFGDPIFAQRVETVFSQKGDTLRAHLLRFDSKEIILNGGIQMRKGRLVKANLVLLLPEHRFEKMPKEIRSRMLKRGPWRGIRLVYHQDQLTAIGSAGPFFRAQWRH